MSANFPPPPPSGGMQPPPPPSQPPARRGFFDQFRGMQWWEIVLTLLPLGLIIIGGLIGAVFGVIGAIINVYIARSRMTVPVRGFVMLGVVLGAYLLWFIVGLLILAAIKPS
jgi:hypothetical protein